MSIYIGHPGIQSRRHNGELTPAGHAYEEILAELRPAARANTRLFHPDAMPVMAHGMETARDRNGRERRLRHWNSATNSWDFTTAGRIFHSRTKFDVLVPIYNNYVDKKTGRVKSLANEAGRHVMLPIDDEYLGEHHLLGDFTISRDAGTALGQRTFIKEALRHHLLELKKNPDLRDRFGRLLFTDFAQSGSYSTWREDAEIEVGLQNVKTHGAAPPVVETVLGRQLHGKFHLPPEMLWTLELEETAKKDFNGRCVAHQLPLVKKRTRIGNDGDRTEDAKEIWKDMKEVEVVLHYLQWRCHDGPRPGEDRSSSLSRPSWTWRRSSRPSSARAGRGSSSTPWSLGHWRT